MHDRSLPLRAQAANGQALAFSAHRTHQIETATGRTQTIIEPKEPSHGGEAPREKELSALGSQARAIF